MGRFLGARPKKSSQKKQKENRTKMEPQQQPPLMELQKKRRMQGLLKKSLKKLLRIKARYEKLQKVQKEMSMPLKSSLREKSRSQRPNLKVISQERLQPLNAR